VDNHGQLMWLGKQFKSLGMALQAMLVTASELSPFSQTPHLPSLAATFFPIEFVK